MSEDIIWCTSTPGSNNHKAIRGQGDLDHALLWSTDPPDWVRLPDKPVLGDYAGKEVRIRKHERKECLCIRDHEVEWWHLESGHVIVCCPHEGFLCCEVARKEKP